MFQQITMKAVAKNQTCRVNKRSRVLCFLHC